MKKLIEGEGLPKPVGPYSPAVSANGFLFVSGQIPKDPITGEIKNDTIQQATRQCLENMKTVLKAADADLSNVVKVTVFMLDLNEFQEMNEVYGEYFGESKPARAAIQAARLPADVRIEIECIAVL